MARQVFRSQTLSRSVGHNSIAEVAAYRAFRFVAYRFLMVFWRGTQTFQFETFSIQEHRKLFKAI